MHTTLHAIFPHYFSENTKTYLTQGTDSRDHVDERNRRFSTLFFLFIHSVIRNLSAISRVLILLLAYELEEESGNLRELIVDRFTLITCNTETVNAWTYCGC